MKADMKTLEVVAAKGRLLGLDMVYDCASGHLGGSFSAMDTLAVLYFDVMNVDPSTGEIFEQSVQINPSDAETTEEQTETSDASPVKKGRGKAKKESAEPVAQDVAFEPVKEAVTIKPDDEDEVLGSFFS